ncbi:peptidase C14 [Pyrrhoderma noxium]|uniref:Peptidase C14 n=1 Tax=Pyrrhoderma noxium TaxID=2282107 RepID=A0A286U791_9AGAM|nr:peptidase C14 [Pyrrhoderma noxium]
MPGLDKPEAATCAAPSMSGSKKALCIAVSYKDAIQRTQRGDPPPVLSGTHRDPETIKRLLTRFFGYQESDITILKDDGKHILPTRENIFKAIDDLIVDAKEGDRFVFHFSGHGGQVPDTNGDEDDGLDETIYPVDVVYDAGKEDAIDNYIVDDEIKERLIDKLPAGTVLTIILDACHSGTGADLEYVHDSDEEEQELKEMWSPASPSKPRVWESLTIEQTSKRPNSRSNPILGSKIKRVGEGDKSDATPPTRLEYIRADKLVTSWAACIDSEIEVECSAGGMLTQAFKKVLENGQTYTHAELKEVLGKQIVKSTLPAKKHFQERGWGKLNCPRPVLSSSRSIDEILHLPFSF